MHSDLLVVLKGKFVISKLLGFIVCGPLLGVQNFIAILPIVVETLQSGQKWWTDQLTLWHRHPLSHAAHKKFTHRHVFLYHLFINVIYFSISSFFNSNIHKILTVCKKTWVMAHQRTVTKNRYIFFIINQGKKIHVLYAYTGDQNTKDESWEGHRADSVKSDMTVHQWGASALPNWPDVNFTEPAFPSQLQWISISSHAFYFKTVHSVDLITPTPALTRHTPL